MCFHLCLQHFVLLFQKMVERFLGPNCENADISIARLMDGNGTKLTYSSFTKRIMWELNQYRKQNSIHWEVFYNWMLLLAEGNVPKLATLKVNICRLEKSCSSLKKNTQHSRLELLLKEPAFAQSKEDNDDILNESLQLFWHVQWVSLNFETSKC